MRKLFSLMASVALVFSLSACERRNVEQVPRVTDESDKVDQQQQPGERYEQRLEESTESAGEDMNEAGEAVGNEVEKGADKVDRSLDR
jgi:predicted small lipoprotein YifL